MTRNQAIEIARQRALNTRESHGYLPVTEADAQTWMPHEWVIDAILWATMQRDLAAQQAAQPVAPNIRAALQQAYLALEELDGPGYLIGGVMHHRISLLLPMLNEAIDSLADAAAQPQQDADELGWLIEMQFGDGLLWWSGCFDDDGTYPPSRLIARMVNDVNKAVRFSRREDAQRVLDAMLAAQPCPLLARAKTLYSVHEHMWPEAAQPQQAEPSRSQKMRDAGFTPRDTRLECDECGQKVTAQFMPIHKCAQQAAQPVSCQAPLDTSQAAQSVALPDLPTHWTKVTDPDGVEVKVWRAFQMRDFARAAIAAAQPQQATDKIGGAA